LALLTDDQRVFAEAGETCDLLWTGRPATGIQFRRADLVLVPFSIMWGGFAIFWESLAIRSGGPWFMAAWGVPFVVVGLYVIFGRFLWDSYARSNTWYALTSDSALILHKNRGGGLQRVYLPSLANIRLTTNDDGSGTISFGNQDVYGVWRNWGPPVTPSFEFIQDVRKVYDLCIRSQRSSSAG
jgi:hypothetical protein